jgi:tetratricopeptide (TPR) repeat protein
MVSLPHEAAPDEPKAAPVIRFDRGVGAAQVWVSAFLIIAVGVVAYSSILGIPFHAEDQKLIVDNTALHSLTTFANAVDPENPRVLTMLSFALNWKLTPDSSAGFHVVNLLLHLTNAVLVFLVCRVLLGPAVSPVIPMIAGMLFAVHPLNTESVNYVVGRAGLLSTFFALVSVWLFLGSRFGYRVSAIGSDEPQIQSGPAGEVGTSSLGLRRVALSVFAYVFAWAADSSVIILPVIILTVDWVASGRRILDRISSHAPLWGVLVVLLAVQYAAGVSGTGLASDRHSFQYLATLAFIPFRLSVVHWPPALPEPQGISVIFFAIICLSGLRNRFVAGAAIAWLMVALLPACGSGVVERNAYFGVAGLAMWIPGLLTLLKRPSLRAMAGLAAAALVIAWGTATYMRNIVWQDPVSLWTDAAEKAPESPIPPRNLGHALLDVGDAMGQNPQAATVLQNAEQNLRRSLSLDPENVQARFDLAEAVLRQGRTDDAVPLFLDVLRLDLDNQPATLNVAILLNEKANASGDQKGLAHSVDYFRRADSLKPLSGEPLARYGMALLALGEFDEAEGALQRVVGSDTASPLAPVVKNVQETLKAVRGMEQQSLTLLSKDPSDATALKMRAQVYALRGQVLQAEYVLERLWRDHRQDFAAWVLMSYVKARMKEPDEFIKDYPPPPKPEEVKSVWMEAARASAGRGLWDAAKAYLEAPAAAADGLPPVLLALGGLALELRQAPRAQDYFQQAAQAYPNDPWPWLRLCDLAIASQANQAAARYLSEAQGRGADAAEVAKRREKLGGAQVAPAEPGRTIIR